MTIKYTILRKETYYLNLRLPDKSFYRKSLKTDSPSKARMIVSKVMGRVKRERFELKDDIDKFVEDIITNKLNHVINLTGALIDPLSNSYKQYFNAWYNNTNDTRFVNHCSGEDRPIQSYNEFIYTKFDRLSESSPSYAYFHSYSGDKIIPNEDAPFYDDFINPTVHSVYLEQLNGEIKNYIKSIRVNDSRLIRQELDELKSKFSKLLPQFINKSQFIAEVKSIAPYYEDIEEGFTKYINQRAITEQAKNEYISAFREYIPTFNDIRLDEISSSMIRDVWETTLYTPKQNTSNAKLYGFELTKEEESEINISLGKDEAKLERKKRLLQKRWDVITDEDYELKSPPLSHLFGESLLKQKKAMLNHMFNFALENDYVHKKPEALNDLSYKVSGEIRKKERIPLPKSEVVKLIQHAYENKENHPENWVILLMVYHGFRTSELTVLDANNIVIDEETSIPYIDILQGKTVSAARKVPIHNDIKQEFLSWVSTKKGRLFNFPPITLSSYYNNLRTELDIPKTDKVGNLLSLYSVRHNVLSQLGHLSSEHKYRLIGHSVQGATKGYVRIELIQANEYIQSITYPIKLS